MVRLLNNLISGKSDNVYAVMNNILKNFMKPRYQSTTQIMAWYILLPVFLLSGILSACITTLNGEEAKGVDSFLEEPEEIDVYRSPFSLPSGVSFVAKEEAVGTFSDNREWKEGVVASSVNGIFQSGNIVRANINGIWVKEGDWVGEEQVVEIATEYVVLTGKETEKRSLPLREAEVELKVIERVR